MENGYRVTISSFGFILVVFLITLGMWGYPKYRVWERGLAGESQLRMAEQNRQIKVCEAKAFEESAKSLANAEVIRAEGVAKANKIIGDSLKDNETYLHYLWINGIEHSSNSVIYIPTEANLPIIEAGRMNNLKSNRSK